MVTFAGFLVESQHYKIPQTIPGVVDAGSKSSFVFGTHFRNAGIGLRGLSLNLTMNGNGRICAGSNTNLEQACLEVGGTLLRILPLSIRNLSLTR